MTDAVVWHDVECGSYGADLPVWRDVAAQAQGPILELGAGTGRVALDLAAHGHEVTAVDVDPDLLRELGRRADARGVEVACLAVDARDLRAEPRFALVLAPMQFMQIAGGRQGRAAVLGAAAAGLAGGGRLAAALSDVTGALAPDDAVPPLPDLGEHDGWVYSSQPLDVRVEPGGVAVERLRQRVSPTGELTEEHHTQRLDALSVELLEQEAAQHGLQAVERRAIGATADHVGSMVVVCRR